MKTLWILDENSIHIATIKAKTYREAKEYADEHYPTEDSYYHDDIGCQCVNARFDYNPDAEIIDWL